MEAYGLGNHKDIDSFVAEKLKRLDAAEADFSALFELMFSEKENLMYEKSEGYRIRQTTYGEAYRDIFRLASTLRRTLALPEGAVVGLSMDNSLLWLELFWAILLTGCRPLLLNLRLSDTALEQALADSGAQAVLSDKRRYSVRTVMAEELTPDEEAFVPKRFGAELLVMSSGTSDHVKICAYSAEEFRCQIHDSYQIIRECTQVKKHYEGYIKQLCFLPFYHVFGLIAMYIWFAFFSRAFVQLNDLAPQTILNTIKRHKVTHIFAVPLFWETVYDQAIKTIRNRGEKTFKKFQKGMAIARRLSGSPALSRAFSKKAFREVRDNLFGESIIFLITGGSAIRPEVIEFFNAIGYHLADGYGMTEIGITSVELSDRKGRAAGARQGHRQICDRGRQKDRHRQVRVVQHPRPRRMCGRQIPHPRQSRRFDRGCQRRKPQPEPDGAAAESCRHQRRLSDQGRKNAGAARVRQPLHRARTAAKAGRSVQGEDRRAAPHGSDRQDRLHLGAADGGR